MISSGIYKQLCPVLYGAGVIDRTGEVCKELGLKKVMLVTDPGIVSVGHDKKVVAALESAGVECVVWADAKPECPSANVKEGAAVARASQVDGIVGLGGGSGLDTAKAISVVTPNKDEILDHLVELFAGDITLEHPQMPVVLIPTTFGTGSECTFVSVVNDPVTDSKMTLVAPPSYAVVDPALAVGLPAFPTAITGLDALSHAVEAAGSKNCTHHTDMLSREVLSFVVEWLPKACADTQALEPREYMALASNFAGIAFNESDVNVGHATAHAIGHTFHIPHGLACAWVTPASFELLGKYFPVKLKKMAPIVGVNCSCEGEELGKVVADANRALMKELGIPTMAEKGIDRETFLAMAESIWQEPLTKKYLYDLTLEDVQNFLTSVYDNYKG